MHKLVVLDRDVSARTRLASEATVLRTIDYGGFVLLIVDDSTIGLLADPSLKGRVRVRDDFDLVGLNGWTIDTRVGEPPDLPTGRRQSAALFEWQFYVVQFVGPIWDEWLEALTAQGDVQVVGYVPNNAYIVRARPAAWTRLEAQAQRPDSPVQWVGVHHPAFRIAQDLEPAIAQGAVEVDLVVQFIDSPEGRIAAQRTRQQAVATYGEDQVAAGRRNVRLRIPASLVTVLAHGPEVLWIEPLREPHPSDERQAQIIAGKVEVVGGEEQPSGVGYLTWLGDHGLTCSEESGLECDGGVFADFRVDVTEAARGFDKGSTSDVPADFKVEGVGNSRVTYLRPEGTEDPLGHGTLVAATIGGDNRAEPGQPEYPATTDDDGYHYGLGIAPSVEMGVTKWAGLGTDFAALIRDAYVSDARISNNSWNSDDNAYSTTSQTYDGLVRDARSDLANNQEMTIVFAVDNDGPNPHTVHDPGTAKNVISVGASENYRKTHNTTANNCGVASEADDARDIATFSARGPTADGRIKPDLVAPGTRISGAASRKICNPATPPVPPCLGLDADPENINLLCNVPNPPCCAVCLMGCGFLRDPVTDSTTYLMAAGTSFAAPAVSAAAALVRQYFRVNEWSTGPAYDVSPAMTKAFLIATTTYMTGDGANDTLPSNSQGYGRLNLGRAFDGTPNQRVNQTTVLAQTGDVYTRTGTVADSSKPLRVVLVWTDAPGEPGANPWANDLDLEIAADTGLFYSGNAFVDADESLCIDPNGVAPPGTLCLIDFNPDSQNNTEAVFLPPGALGAYTITVRAANITKNGVPGFPQRDDLTDQDFALFVYNGMDP